MAGLDINGFTPESGAVILSESIEELQDDSNVSIASNIQDPAYLILANESNAQAGLWEAIEAVYYSQFPDTAEGINLDYAVSFNGIQRIKPRYSTATLTLTNDTASPATIPAGTLFRQSSTLKEWVTTSAVVIPASGTITAGASCTEYGAFTAPIGTIDTIVNPISGLDEVTNLAAATVGRLVETDSELRNRRVGNFFQSSGGVTASIANKVLSECDGVDFTTWRENRTDSTDVNGLPPHSYEIIVDGGTSLDIAETILKYGGGGIQTYGAVSNSVTDSEGNVYTIKHSTVTPVPIYLIVNIVTNGDYAVDGDDQVKEALITYFATLARGEDVLNWKLSGALISVDGIDSITSILQGIAPAPGTSANITISATQRANLSISNITVNN
jgi:uncharacterized phage protein gp47/JayE